MGESNNSRYRAKLGRIALAATLFGLGSYLMLRTQLVDQMLLRWSYAVEKGRLEAVRQSMASHPQGTTSSEQVRRVAALVSPAVVSITASAQIPSQDEAGIDSPIQKLQEWLKNPSAPPRTTPDDGVPRDSRNPEDGPDLFKIGSGSGFVIDEHEGLVLTCNHVIESADRIEIELADGRRLRARLLGADAKTDVALLAVEPQALHALELGDSDGIDVGEDVLAVGSPFGFGGSFSKGIISAKGRANWGIGAAEYAGFIQTDAVINPGNSGGPLVNMNGEVVGMAMAIASQSGVSDGVGFAIPSSRIRRLLPLLKQGSAIQRGYLGVEIESVHGVRDAAEELGWEEAYGVLIEGVLADSPAETAGLRANDIVVEYQDKVVRTTVELMDEVAFTTPGDQATLKVWRDRQWIQLMLTVEPQPTDFRTFRSVRPRPQ